MSNLTFTDYQAKARLTSLETQIGGLPIIYPTLGLTNEAGEVAGKIKKVFRDNDGTFDKGQLQVMKKELGDVLWYISEISSVLGISLEEIAQENLTKLQSRKARGKLQGSGDER